MLASRAVSWTEPWCSRTHSAASRLVHLRTLVGHQSGSGDKVELSLLIDISAKLATAATPRLSLADLSGLLGLHNTTAAGSLGDCQWHGEESEMNSAHSRSRCHIRP